MSKSVVEAVAAQLRPNFPRGHKQLFLPNHVLTFIRPKPKQSPKLASFVVPLHFNKLDIRDYLFHAYNVRVVGVRSYITPRPLERKYGRMTGRLFRPRPQKTMMVELEKPFVWPEKPTGDDLKDFDHAVSEKFRKARALQLKWEQDGMSGVLHTPTDSPPSVDRELLRQIASELLEGKEKWKNGITLDERWKTILEEDSKSK